MGINTDSYNCLSALHRISGTTRQVDLNLHAPGKRFLRESSILGKIVEVRHSCLKDKEKGTGRCRGEGRYETG